MTSLVVHDMTVPWSSADPALRMTAEPRPFFGAETAAGRLRHDGGAAGTAEFVPPDPLDLAGAEELRLWIQADRPADGTAGRPYYLALSYQDAADGPSDRHRWYLPVAAPGSWEQRRIGIEGDRRGAVRRLALEPLGPEPFTVRLTPLLAVREEMLGDVERALQDALAGVEPPGLAGVPLAGAAGAGATAVPVAAPGFAAGNRVRLDGGTAGAEVHDVIQAVSDPATGRTTLTLARPLAGSFTASATVTVLVPVTDEPVNPRIVLASLDVREDPARSWHLDQRDSFRPRGALTVCSVRGPARAYLADYQVEVVTARDRSALVGAVVHRLSADRVLWVDGSPAPVWIVQAPLLERDSRGPAPVYVRVGAHAETAPRREVACVARVESRAGQLREDGPAHPPAGLGRPGVGDDTEGTS
ncbi:hypothetical protein AGRA3207_002113 [Actinomadura graeca]|uniref:Phage tail protein n=1 Tax=Actinomadura graeca TaxID=2750812 RepID=A0ABX8QR51_9ACTN|nr:hypothetical protein [Actinomadura graeca]QXJ21276.1 hypothetical protein AGRA3207_002113 [Actinomadura graeca]